MLRQMLYISRKNYIEIAAIKLAPDTEKIQYTYRVTCIAPLNKGHSSILTISTHRTYRQAYNPSIKK